MSTAESDPDSAVLVAFSAIEQTVRALASPYGHIQGFNDAVVKLAGAEVLSPDLVDVLLNFSTIQKGNCTSAQCHQHRDGEVLR